MYLLPSPFVAPIFNTSSSESKSRKSVQKFLSQLASSSQQAATLQKLTLGAIATDLLSRECRMPRCPADHDPATVEDNVLQALLMRTDIIPWTAHDHVRPYDSVGKTPDPHHTSAGFALGLLSMWDVDIQPMIKAMRNVDIWDEADGGDLDTMYNTLTSLLRDKPVLSRLFLLLAQEHNLTPIKKRDRKKLDLDPTTKPDEISGSASTGLGTMINPVSVFAEPVSNVMPEALESVIWEVSEYVTTRYLLPCIGNEIGGHINSYSQRIPAAVRTQNLNLNRISMAGTKYFLPTAGWGPRNGNITHLIDAVRNDMSLSSEAGVPSMAGRGGAGSMSTVDPVGKTKIFMRERKKDDPLRNTVSKIHQELQFSTHVTERAFYSDIMTDQEKRIAEHMCNITPYDGESTKNAPRRLVLLVPLVGKDGEFIASESERENPAAQDRWMNRNRYKQIYVEWTYTSAVVAGLLVAESHSEETCINLGRFILAKRHAEEHVATANKCMGRCALSTKLRKQFKKRSGPQWILSEAWQPLAAMRASFSALCATKTLSDPMNGLTEAKISDLKNLKVARINRGMQRTRNSRPRADLWLKLPNETWVDRPDTHVGHAHSLITNGETSTENNRVTNEVEGKNANIILRSMTRRMVEAVLETEGFDMLDEILRATVVGMARVSAQEKRCVEKHLEHSDRLVEKYASMIDDGVYIPHLAPAGAREHCFLQPRAQMKQNALDATRRTPSSDPAPHAARYIPNIVVSDWVPEAVNKAQIINALRIVGASNVVSRAKKTLWVG